MDKKFILSPAQPCPITPLEDVTLVRIPLSERTPLKSVKKRAKVAKGALVASHPSPNVGDAHCPIDGIIKDVTSMFIEVEYAPLPPSAETAPAAEGQESAPVNELEVRPTPVNFDGLGPVELGKALKQLGIHIRPFTRPCELFIINCINPEPGMLYTEALLDQYMDTIKAGFAMLKRLNDAPRFVLAIPQGIKASIEGTESVSVKPEYPISLARPLIRAITGKEDTKPVTLVRLHNIFLLGLVAQNGLPLTNTVVTALGKNYFAPLGTPISTFLEKSGVTPEPGDGIVLGGYMRGVAISGVRTGLRRFDDAIQFIKKGTSPELGDNPCINCGACVSVCPMRLRPNMLSRYSEFEQYESCKKEFIEICIECGMCGWVCPACRPMQQHFRMAKNALGLSTFQHRLRG